MKFRVIVSVGFQKPDKFDKSNRLKTHDLGVP